MPTTFTQGQFAPFSSLSIKATIGAGLIAGTVFLVLELIMVPAFLGMPAWAPVRMIAAIAMGRDVLPPPATFDAGILAVAVLVHFALSLVYAFVFAVIALGRAAGTASLIGAAFGLALYLLNFYVFTAVFPWFVDARNWVSIAAHVVYGLVLGWSHTSLANRSTARAIG
jgi:hypothetical protein